VSSFIIIYLTIIRELDNKVIDPGIVTDQSAMGYLHNTIPLSAGNGMYFSAQIGIHPIFFH